ncbi:MAG: hypothetical protein JRD69_05255 [Deltaproteobacteria bacterium]|nr:hypothetical protein [Deltaproteobacteria bacterium]
MAQEHSFASPAPAGLASLTVATFGFGAVFMGLIDISGFPLLAAWLLACFAVQYTTAVMELKDHNIAGGNVFLFFGAFFCLAAAFSVFFKWYAVSFMIGPKAAKEAMDTAMAMAGVTDVTMLTPEQLMAAKAGIGKAVGAAMAKMVVVEGWMWMAGALFVTGVIPAYVKSPLFWLCIPLTIALWMIVGMDTGWYGDHSWKPVIGYILVASGTYAAYLSSAIITNTVHGKAVLWVPPGIMK